MVISNKLRVLYAVTVMGILVACGQKPQACIPETGSNEVAEVPAVSAPVSKTKLELPEDIHEAYFRLEILQHGAPGELLTLGDLSFDSEYSLDDPILNVYPRFTQLDCLYRASDTFCAYGRFGEVTDDELEQHIPYLFNADVIKLTGVAQCSDKICIDKEGKILGAIQPQMYLFLKTHCGLDHWGKYNCESL